MYIIGIDPGLKGAVCVLQDEDRYVFDMPTMKHGCEEKKRMVDAEALWEQLPHNGQPDVVGIELPQWRRGISAKSMTTAWFNYGRLTAGFIKWEGIQAKTWKDYLGLSSDKEESIRVARELLPGLDITNDGRAEAALIAFYTARIAGYRPHEMIQVQ